MTNVENLELVSFDKSYVQSLQEWRNHYSATDHNPFETRTIKELELRLSQESSDLSLIYKTNDFRWFGRLDGNVVSNISLKNINEMMKTAEIGYGVGPEWQNKGVGKKTVKLLMDKVFSITDLRKIYAYVHIENKPSCCLLESLGFQKEGLLREHYMLNGKAVDQVFYGLLKDEWDICQKEVLNEDE